MSKADKIYDEAQEAEIFGFGDEKEEKRALDLYREAAGMGHFLSQWHLAEHLYLFGDSKRDEAECYKWYEACALQHKYPPAMYHAGIHYMLSRKGVRKGVFFLEQAAEKGIGEAIAWLGRHYIHWRKSEKLHRKGFKLLCKVYEGKVSYLYGDDTRGDLYCLLGDCYKEGKGTKVNPEMAFKSYKVASDEGDLDGQVQLGRCYMEGFGVEKDGKKAFECFNISSEYYGDAQYMVGMCYLNGIGVKKDEKEGVRWLEMAVEDNWGEPMYRLALCYINGVGVEKDYDKGIELMKRAFDEGAIFEAYEYLHEIFPDEYPFKE